MTSNKTHSLYQQTSDLLTGYPEFLIAKEEDETIIQNIMESQSMNLHNLAFISYSRRPSLKMSFQESSITPLILMDREKKTMGVIGEKDLYINGKKESSYYTSDLRIDSKSSSRVKLKFRSFYLDLIKKMQKPCFTAILKANEKALQALASEKKGIYYNPVHHYTARTLLVMPSLKFTKKTLLSKKYSIQEENYEQKDIKSFIDKKISNSELAHPVDPSHQCFTIRDHQLAIKGVFGLKKPNYRSLFIKPNSFAVNFWMKTIHTLFGLDYTKKVPWHYITYLMFEDELKGKELLKYLTQYLYQKRIIKNGELLLISHPKKSNLSLEIATPQFIVEGILYRVEDQKQESEIQGDVYLNPLFL